MLTLLNGGDGAISPHSPLFYSGSSPVYMILLGFRPSVLEIASGSGSGPSVLYR